MQLQGDVLEQLARLKSEGVIELNPQYVELQKARLGRVQMATA